MEARCQVRYIRISPSKVGIVADLVRGKPVREALAILRYTPKKASKVVEKAIRSAIANAENNHEMNGDLLYVSEIYVGQGPTLRRYRPRARGIAYPIQKKTSHLTVILKEREEG
ncbi:MAG: 50S ribosomal protein L22 [Bacillota bacterium]|jgi:large subunit ribosomal protein L22|nr:50S ribosomal protein L22 [Candidatus Fermentithermobacillaceae bacterium]